MCYGNDDMQIVILSVPIYSALMVFESLWHHQMERVSALLVLCKGNPLVTSGFPSQRSSNMDLWCSSVASLNKHLNKHLIGQ